MDTIGDRDVRAKMREEVEKSIVRPRKVYPGLLNVWCVSNGIEKLLLQVSHTLLKSMESGSAS